MTFYLILNQFTSPCLFLPIWKSPPPKWVCKMRNWNLSLICDSSMKFWGYWGLSLQSCAYQTMTLSLSYVLSPIKWVLDFNTIQRQVKSNMLQEKKQWRDVSPESIVTLTEVPGIWEAQALLGRCCMSGHGAMARVPSPFPSAQILIY